MREMVLGGSHSSVAWKVTVAVSALLRSQVTESQIGAGNDLRNT